MKSPFYHPLMALALLALSTFDYQLSSALAQGTAFTYQGQLQNNGSPAGGTYNLTFSLFNTNTSGAAIAGPVTNNAVSLTNGLFTVVINFGASVFTGQTNWLQIGVATNGVSSFTPLTPRQQVTPVPYAIYAASASNLLGTLPVAQLSGAVANGQLANNSVTVSAGSGLSGGGTVALGGSTTLNNAGVLAVTGNADITAATTSGAVTLGDTGTNAAFPRTLVKRDATGSFAATNLSLYGILTMGNGNDYHAVINEIGGSSFVYADANNNFSAGESAGYGSGGTLGSFNTAIGNAALVNTVGGSDNTAVGWGTMAYNFYGSNNTAVGYSALGQLGNVGRIGGGNNLALGNLAGYNFTGNESNNIDLGNAGNTGESDTIRLGTPGIQTNTFIAGVINGNGAGLTNLNAAQLNGSVPSAALTSVPAASLTGTVPLAQLSGITSNQLNALTWQLATNLNGGNAALASNVVSGISITNAFITNSVFAGYGSGLSNLNAAQLTGSVPSAALTSVPAASLTGTVPLAQLPGAVVTNNNATSVTLNGTFGGTLSGNGSGLTNLNASQLSSGVVPLNVLPGFQSASNYATVGGGFGNTASGPQATVGGGSGNTASGTNSTVAGGLNNLASTNEATVAGGHGNAATGGFQPTVGGGYENTASASYATVSGGRNNTNNGISATISGGATNTASVNYATVGGGNLNSASGLASLIGGGQNNNASGGYAAIGGGTSNTNSSNAGTISGGQDNISSGQYQSAVGGGYGNQATNSYAMVPGGANNVAGGEFSFAAGNNAQALFQGDFVWADSQSAAFSSTGNDQFLIRAQGGVGINTSSLNGAMLTVQGSVTGGFGTPEALFQNNGTAANASPALRVVGYGNYPNGVLNVSDQGTGLIAQFGNAGAFVSQLDTNGNWTANSFNGDGSGLTTLNASQLGNGTIPNSVLSGFQGNADAVGGGQNNISSAQYQSTVGGGYGNTASGNYATVGGGIANYASAAYAAVGGGIANNASGGYAAIGGGESNTNSSQAGVIAGGQNNIASGQYQATVGGGYGNKATNNYATVPGGYQNLAGGQYSLAAGQQAQAVHQGAFVWADSQNAAFPSTANDQFSVRAQGGVKFVTSGAGVTVDGQPVAKSYGVPISSGPFTISQPGSYYLTTNLTVHTTDAIDIYANGVTLDLNGFTISSTATSASGIAIYLALSNTATTFGNTDITISNGHIVSGVTNNNGTFNGPGFYNGIQANGRPNNILVSGVSVSGVMGYGINLFSPQEIGGVVSSTLVDSCTVNTVGGDGIDADSVSHCTAYNCGGAGIYASTVSDSRGESDINSPGITANSSVNNSYGTSVGGEGIFAFAVNNCFGVSTSSLGIFAENANGCYGFSENSIGLYGYIANGCHGNSVNGVGLSAGSAIACYGYSEYFEAITAAIANSCTSLSGNNTTNDITYKYNMP